MRYRQITTEDYNDFYLDYDTDDCCLIVWNGSGDMTGPFGEWDAYQVYLELKAIFEGDI